MYRKRDNPSSLSLHISENMYYLSISKIQSGSPTLLVFFFPSRPTWNEQLQAKLFLLFKRNSHESNITRPTTVRGLVEGRKVHFIRNLLSLLSVRKCDHTLSRHPLVVNGTINVVLSVFGSLTDWWPLQDVSCLSPSACWDRFQLHCSFTNSL